MRTIHFFLVHLLMAMAALLSPANAASNQAQQPPEIGFAIVKTSRVAVMEGLLVPGGSFGKQIDSNFSAFLIKHRNEYLLFDSGMGRQIEQQYRADMPLWWRPFFKYEAPVLPAREQLDRAGIPPLSRVILSHSHWDHAGGILDFPEAKIGVAAAEM
ncbi:MAG: MBL fold metallo-hydrolase, partial [Burkholderiaceae bacterium]|nr:MBL fold metallo-hydrolase [Burkholderiaceae bacterium]